MTVAAVQPLAQYIEDGTTMTFSAPFRYLAASDLIVTRIQNGTVSALVLGTDYTATTGPTDAGGSVTLLSTVAGAALSITRSTARSQQSDFQNTTRFPAGTVEGGYDRAMLIVQEHDVELGRAMQAPRGETLGDMPARATRASKYLGFDTNGQPLAVDEPIGDALLRGQVALPAATLLGALPYDAGIADNRGTSAAAALQALASSGAGEVTIAGKFFESISTLTGATKLAAQVLVPAGQGWQGTGQDTWFAVDAADPCPNGYFLLNTKADYTAAQSYKLKPGKRFGRLNFDGRTAKANGKNPVGIVVAGPGYTIHDIYAYGMQTVVRGADGVTGGGVDPHADQLRISKVHLNNQPTTADFNPAAASSARYGIDWLRTPAGADGAVIEQCQADYSGSGTSAVRCRFIGLRGFTSARIESCINGDLYLYESTAKVMNCYYEHGVVSVQASEVTIENCQFWMRNPATMGTDLGVTPVQVLAPPAGGYLISQRPTSLTLRDCAFNYDGTGALQGYSTSNANFSTPAGIYATISVNNCWRGAPLTNGRGWYHRLGLQCGDADFDAYAHFASVESRLVASGTVGGKRWLISASRGPLVLNSGTTANGLEVAVLDSTYGTKWKIASGTYYYKAAILQDKVRGIGLLGGLEVSVAATLNGNSVALGLGYSLPAGGFIARVYRGSASGSYDSYVDVPVVEAGFLHDNGADLSGFAWISRTAGAADAVNIGLSGGIDLRPGERTVTSDAYGRVTAWSQTGDMPTLGSWRKQDEVRFTVPVVVGNKVQVGWRRITNCTLASPAHVLGTDWTAIWDTIPPAEGQGVANGAATTIYLQPGERVARVRPTSGNQVINVASACEVENYWFWVNMTQQNPGSVTLTIVKGSTGATAATLSGAGLYLVVWRSDLATWTVARLADAPINGTIDQGVNLGEQYTSSATVTADPNARLINVTSAAAAVTITMAAATEQNGRTVKLIIRAYTNTVTVLRSDGNSSSAGVLVQTGLYELVFTQGVWKATRIGAVPA